MDTNTIDFTDAMRNPDRIHIDAALLEHRHFHIEIEDPSLPDGLYRLIPIKARDGHFSFQQDRQIGDISLRDQLITDRLPAVHHFRKLWKRIVEAHRQHLHRPDFRMKHRVARLRE